MRLAYIVASPGIPVQGPSGCSAHVRDFVRALQKQHDVRIFAARQADHRGVFGPPMAATTSGVSGWPSWLSTLRELREIRTARWLEARLLAAIDDGWVPDLLIERHSLFSDVSWRVGRRLAIPWVLEVNAPLAEERQRFEHLGLVRLATHWERRVLRAAPQVIAVSRWLEQWLVDDVGCRQVHHIANGVADIVGDRERGRRLLGIDSVVPLIGFVGSMKPWHGWQVIPNMAKKLGAQVAFIGHSGCTLATDSIHKEVYDPQSLADVVAAFDVGVAPYPQSAPPWFCPLKILLYRSQGVPVVATDVGACKELVGEAGSVVSADRPDDMIPAIQFWLKRRCKPFVRSWERVVQEFLSVIKC